MSDECYFCADDSDVLERHHIVPDRHGGSDTPENIVTVCPTCHRKLERLYGRRFYDQLGVNDVAEESKEEETLLRLASIYWDLFSSPPNTVPESPSVRQLISEYHSRHDTQLEYCRGCESSTLLLERGDSLACARCGVVADEGGAVDPDDGLFRRWFDE